MLKQSFVNAIYVSLPCINHHIHSNRYMNPAGLTEVSLSKAKIENTAKGMCFANGVQMVTLDWVCHYTQKIVTHKLRK